MTGMLPTLFMTCWALICASALLATTAVVGIVWVRRCSGSLPAALADTLDEVLVARDMFRDRHVANIQTRSLRVAERSWRSVKTFPPLHR